MAEDTKTPTEGEPATDPGEAEAERIFLVVVDETEEMQKALHFACRRALHTGGRVALLGNRPAEKNAAALAMLGHAVLLGQRDHRLRKAARLGGVAPIEAVQQREIEGMGPGAGMGYALCPVQRLGLAP